MADRYSQLHEVKITSDENGRTHVILNGVDISHSCDRFTLEQVGGEYPVLRLEVRTPNVDAFLSATRVSNVGDYTKTPEEFKAAVQVSIPEECRGRENG